MIIEHLDLDVPEGKVACQSVSLVHRSWTHLAQRRLFDIFRADFPRCIPALVFLSNAPRLAAYVSRLDPKFRVFQQHEIVWLGAVFANITQLVINHSNVEGTIAEIVNALSAFPSLSVLNLMSGEGPNASNSVLSFPPSMKLQMMTTGGAINVINSVLDGCSQSTSPHSLTHMAVAFQTHVPIPISAWLDFTRIAQKFTILKTLYLMLSPMSQDQHYGLEKSDAGMPHALHTICP
jgi:hypothetical protein